MKVDCYASREGTSKRKRTIREDDDEKEGKQRA